MTPDAEAVALAWLANHLHLLECPRCGGQWICRRSLGVIFHKCQPSPSYYDWRTPHQRAEEKRMSWARRLLGDGLIEAVEQRDGPDSLLREVD